MSHPDSDFVTHLLELLEPFGEVNPKRMFGGHGIFREGLMFALVADGVLYLKVDDKNRSEFEALDLPPFRFEMKNGKTGAMSYRQCPDDALENAAEMTRWAESAFAAALRNAASKKRKTSPKKKNSR